MGGFTAALQRFGIGRLAAVLGVAFGVTAVRVALMLRIGQEPDALLYSNLDLREAGEITAALDQQGIKYKTRGDGSTIMVHRDDVGEARLMLASQGMVTSGSVGYEIFDNQSVLGQTEFQQNINAKRAIEGELARTLLDMDGISSARVMIALPQRELFQAEAAPPTASVVVGVRGRDLSGEKVRAIRNVIASAVPNLKPDRVTVTDTANRVLAAGSEDAGFSGALADGKKAEVETRMQARIKELVEGVVGVGAARVTVSADLDLSRQTTQEQRYDPDGQVVRSSQVNASNSTDSSGQTVGGATATENIPGGEAETIPVGSSAGEESEITNYEISSTTTTTVREPGAIEKLSVAVAVDGVTTPAANGEGEPTYAPRSEEEMQRIRALVASAAGIDEARGDKLEVVNVRFARETPVTGGTEAKSSLFDFGKNDIMRAVELAVLLITGLLLIFFVLRPLLKAATGGGSAVALAAPAGAPGMVVTPLQMSPDGTVAMTPQAQIAGPSDMEQRLDIARIEGQVKASSVKKVADFVEKHPEESTALLRSWVHEG